MYRHAQKNIIYLAAVILPLLLAGVASADSKIRSIKEGNKLFEKGEYVKSAEKYSDALKKEPNSDIVNFNLGAAFYKQEDYKAAISHFQRSLLTEDEQLNEKAHYNLGNSLYRSGIAQEKNNDLSSAVSSLEKAVSHYEKSLSTDPKDEDAKFNHEFVSKELERLKKKLQQQKKKQEKQQSPKKEGKEGQKEAGQNQQQSPNEQKQNQEAADQKDSQKKQEQGQKQKAVQIDQEKNKQGSEQNSAQEQRQAPKDQTAQSQASNENENKKLMEQKEAQMLLDQYRQTEQPMGLFNPLKTKRDLTDVEKDW